MGHQNFESQEEKLKPESDTQLSPFWNNRKLKLRSISYLAVATFLLTLPWSLSAVFLVPVLFFPVGLTGWVTNFNFEGVYLLASVLLWIPYVGMADAIVRSNNKKKVVILYIMLISLLILNVVGCQIGAPKAASDIN